nr:MAG: hypothetical protein [Lokiarchaeota virus Ratatoskr Meg22_1012]
MKKYTVIFMKGDPYEEYSEDFDSLDEAIKEVIESGEYDEDYSVSIFTRVDVPKEKIILARIGYLLERKKIIEEKKLTIPKWWYDEMDRIRKYLSEVEE